MPCRILVISGRPKSGKWDMVPARAFKIRWMLSNTDKMTGSSSFTISRGRSPVKLPVRISYKDGDFLSGILTSENLPK